MTEMKYYNLYPFDRDAKRIQLESDAPLVDPLGLGAIPSRNFAKGDDEGDNDEDNDKNGDEGDASDEDQVDDDNILMNSSKD
jgi:hypothetical protein